MRLVPLIAMLQVARDRFGDVNIEVSDGYGDPDGGEFEVHHLLETEYSKESYHLGLKEESCD
jgi:hypothetical protein